MTCKPINVIGPGSPFWPGPPSRERAKLILFNTMTDNRGRMYGRINGAWVNLRTQADYDKLNRTLGLLSTLRLKPAGQPG